MTIKTNVWSVRSLVNSNIEASMTFITIISLNKENTVLQFSWRSINHVSTKRTVSH